MEAHHERVIQRLIELFANDPRFLALIIGGSVAKGRAQKYSDLDILLVASDEEYRKRQQSGDFWYLNREICDYPGGYVDGKVIDLQFLQDVVERGSEPARAAFVGAFCAYSHLPELPELVSRIPVYQEQDRDAKMAAFYSQIQVLNWFVGEAEKRNDRYLMTHAVSELVLYGGRLILAYNRILYPYHKWLLHELEHAKEKPVNLMILISTLLEHPSKEHAQAFVESLTGFHNWGVSYDQAIVSFLEKREWQWRIGCTSLEDW